MFQQISAAYQRLTDEGEDSDEEDFEGDMEMDDDLIFEFFAYSELPARLAAAAACASMLFWRSRATVRPHGGGCMSA